MAMVAWMRGCAGAQARGVRRASSALHDLRSGDADGQLRRRQAQALVRARRVRNFRVSARDVRLTTEGSTGRGPRACVTAGTQLLCTTRVKIGGTECAVLRADTGRCVYSRPSDAQVLCSADAFARYPRSRNAHIFADPTPTPLDRATERRPQRPQTIISS